MLLIFCQKSKNYAKLINERQYKMLQYAIFLKIFP